MTGIFPETVAGGVPIRNPDGTPTNPPDVNNAYVPAPGYVSDCELTALPSDCTARIEARQINAIVSELLAFAECLDPDGPWQCSQTNNICMSFNVWTVAFTAQTQAAIDAAIAAAEGLDESKFVDVAGDTMTGDLLFNKDGPAIRFNNIGATATVIDSSHNSSLRWRLVLGDTVAETGGNAGFDFALLAATDAGAPAATPILKGTRSTNLLTVAGDPTAPLGIATKQYTDAGSGTKVNKAGDTMTGPLVLPGDPASGLQAATKAYVDAKVASGSVPSGSVMLFYNAAAPTGWTRVTAHHDKALRVVGNTAGGVAGGTNPFSTVQAQSNVGNHTLTLGELPTGISCTWTATIAAYPSGSSNFYFPMINAAAPWYQLGILSSATTTVPPGYNVAYGNTTVAPTSGNIVSGGNSAAATSTNTGGGAHNHPITMAVQYLDVIVASKD